jgi:hypothetical protein
MVVIMNREIITDLNNILSHVACAIDYGYYDDVLMTDFANLTGFVTDNEINWYCTDTEENKKQGYTQEDYEQWKERITEWRDKYCKGVK